MGNAVDFMRVRGDGDGTVNRLNQWSPKWAVPPPGGRWDY
jgi:hypothetical protein